ncbi:MAG: hypothetical protein GY887_01370 [Halieaceae bacterium]|nr:hypothetical protein [Halieaceae bacterium]
MRVLRTFWILILGLILASCSGTTFVYNRLDVILPWYIDDYADLNGHQDAYLDEVLAPFLNWHRQQELPAYLSVIEDIEAHLDDTLTGADVAEIFSEFEAAWLRIEARGLDWLLDLGGQLSDKQMANVIEALWEQQEEFEEEYLERDDAEFYEDSYDNLLDNVEEFLGNVSDAQREQLRLAANQLQRSDVEWLKERAEWIEELSVLLEAEPGWERAVRDAVRQRREKPALKYREIYTHNMAIIFSAVAAVVNSRSERQDKYLRNRLAEVREDLQALADQGAL